MKKIISLHFLLCVLIVANNTNAQNITCGIERTNVYLPLLIGKKVAIVGNQTSIFDNKTHLVDSLMNLKINIVKIFTPEHGFRGNIEAGGKVNSGKDNKTGLPIISLYGKKFKPSKEDLKDIDILIFDIQDVGCRFYTYISTLHYVMEAAAENDKMLIVFDRPNPNGFYITGTVLKDTSLVSFVGIHPVPIVYGMTIGEYAKMINGERWLGTSAKRVIGEKSNLKCNLTIIPLLNYNHNCLYRLPIPPSPNLTTMNAIYLYPFLCFFEGTPVSVGRGTDLPFEIVGYPQYHSADTSAIIEFIPCSINGIADNPPYKDKLCKGKRIVEGTSFTILQNNSPLNIFSLVIEIYKNYPAKNTFFKPFFDKLAGSTEVKEVIMGNVNYKTYEQKLTKDLKEFNVVRKKYLIYEDVNTYTN